MMYIIDRYVPIFFQSDFTYFKLKVQCTLHYWYNPGPLLRWDLMIVSMSVKSKLSAWCDKMNRNCAAVKRDMFWGVFQGVLCQFEFMGKLLFWVSATSHWYYLGYNHNVRYFCSQFCDSIINWQKTRDDDFKTEMIWPFVCRL